MDTTLIIRADASAKTGYGHIMRCLSLAQAWRTSGGQAVFLSDQIPANLARRLNSEEFSMEPLACTPGTRDDARTTTALTRSLQASWIIADGYHFTAAYHQALQDSGAKLLIVDDTAMLDLFCADIILNHNAHAAFDMYSRREPGTLPLLGNRYTLLRSEFTSAAQRRRSIADTARKVLVTMGGSDPNNLTAHVIEALNTVTKHRFSIKAVGEGVKAVQPQNSRHRIELTAHEPDMPKAMAWADIAVSAGGGTCWELMYTGLPAALIISADNQSQSTKTSCALGAAVSLGTFNKVNRETISEALCSLSENRSQRRAMSDAGQIHIDGRGADRIVNAMNFLHNDRRFPGPCHVRPAGVSDALDIWRLRNEEQVRSQSFNPNPVSLEEHISWFSRAVTSPDSLTLIAEVNGVHVGNIRYDKNPAGTVDLHYAVVPFFRGRGIGTRLLETWKEACGRFHVHKVSGFVFADNSASVHSFMKAGFSRSGSTVKNGKPVVQFSHTAA